MTILAALLVLLTSFTTLVSLAVTRMPELGVDLVGAAAPIAALIAASLRPGAWPAPSPVWIPALAACHAALRASLGAAGEPAAAALAMGALTTGVGLWLGWTTGARARRLETALEGIVDAAPALPEMQGAGKSAMHRELRRARRYERPLSVVSLSPARALRREELDRIVSEMRRSAMHRHTDARLASLLAERIDGASVVAREGDHFALLLAETDGRGARQAIARIEQEFSKELGISLRFGISSFPDEETTLTGLLESSELEMHRTQTWSDSAPGASEALP